MMKKFGLIGKKLEHSFSKNYFEKKFLELKLSDYSYSLFPLIELTEINSLLENEKELVGLNVTIPYKEAIINYLDELDDIANEVKAVNCIKLSLKNNKLHLKGYNTDAFGFRQSLKPFLEPQHERALLLGTGGASKAVSYVLNKLGIPVWQVTRNKTADNQFTYEELSVDVIKHFKLIINSTPIGMFPHDHDCPNLPYEGIEHDFLLYDLVYNPEETLFLKKGRERGAVCINGLSMLYHQADEAWRIWNKD
jgi:shikimate dehydrogenase